MRASEEAAVFPVRAATHHSTLPVVSDVWDNMLNEGKLSVLSMVLEPLTVRKSRGAVSIFTRSLKKIAFSPFSQDKSQQEIYTHLTELETFVRRMMSKDQDRFR